jgi:hypothetical protein
MWRTSLPNKRMLIRIYFVCGYHCCVDGPINAIVQDNRTDVTKNKYTIFKAVTIRSTNWEQALLVAKELSTV